MLHLVGVLKNLLKFSNAETLKKVVLPIFYDVDPSQVRNPIGYFDESLTRRFGAQRTEKWKTALTKVANLSGWDSRNVVYGHESELIESIIKRVLQEVSQTSLDVACYPVGIDSSIKDLIELLFKSGCQDDVRMIGIYGIGGIGKTTLAKAFYNQICRHFGSSCFLSNVRSEAGTFNGLVKLQEKLLHQILKTKDFEVNDVAEGVSLIKARLGSMKVLIVLDDVDHISQLESLIRERNWFGSGSLIIVTTRDKHLLCGLTTKEKFKAKLLYDNEAMQLFSCRAFNSFFPPHEYVGLSQEIIKYSGGLPLALVTLGSHLRGRSVEEWRHEFVKLRAIPHSDIQKILKISFDGLDYDTQSVFLDIACAFHGFFEDEVTKILNACGFHSESAIATLVQKHLLHRAWHRLVMHDLVRAMGREIVRMESPRDPGKRSRLVIPQEVCYVLRGNKGSKKVQVLKVDRWTLKGVNLSTMAFKKMKNLRVLIIDKLHISGDFELLSKELRWLSWQNCPLKYIPSNFPAKNLVVIDMRKSDIQEFGLNLQCCKSLKRLDLSDCKSLKRTPNFNGLQSLEFLLLNGCSSLRKIHPSIGNLCRLRLLNLRGCKKLMDPPSSICQLKSLGWLDISGCSYIKTLPVDFGVMPGLRTLSALETDIKQWHRKLVNITGLENLPSIERINMLNCTSLQNPFKEGFFSAPALAFPSREYPHLGIEIYLQSNEIPDWCSNQVTASSISFTMPTHNKEYQFLGMIVWCVRELVKVPSSGPWQGFGFSISGEMFSGVFSRYDNVIPAEHMELSCVLHRSYLDTPFEGAIKGGEKMELFELSKYITVKKIGIHLLYLDQQGKVTSLPALVDHSHSQINRSQDLNEVSLEQESRDGRSILKMIRASFPINPLSLYLSVSVYLLFLMIVLHYVAL
ncbi:hypothetical protein KY290_008977 [Solanum tuberosum]|uniref:ADP-ribosyl cyclase/cyclic ADP-ribose hydrolase n=1 Tax=Solanum tuberosum TaxID=4113 RepID=A0ABQ7W9Y5_SOLTU|nr:hypothetical protein KY289_009339 [Solanum tuberosum]KAH0716029.1 hypothetical protein KY284_008934 [Solanum tuberosum]KAH0777566.1 hypothetical protein KY290_008977 [Solanum tuberosum]